MTMIPDNIENNFSHSLDTNFQVFIEKLPNVQFFVQDIPIPDISAMPGTATTWAGDLPFYPDKIEWDPLTVGFVVDEHWWAYEELFSWLVAVANPENPSKSEMIHTDLTVLVLNANKIPVLKITYRDAFPINLGGISYNTSGNGTDISGTVQFRYSYAKLERMDNSKPPIRHIPPIPNVPKYPNAKPSPPWPDIRLPKN